MASNQEEREFFDFQQYWRIIKKRWFVTLLVISSVVGVTVFTTLRQKPIYKAESKLIFDKTNRVSSLTKLSVDVGELSGVTQTSNPLDTEAEVIRSHPIVHKAVTKLNLKDATGKFLETEEILKRLKVESIRGTDILVIQYRSNDPKETADFTNMLVRYYLENNIRTNRLEATAAGELLRNQLPGLESKVVQAEAALRKFKEENKVVDLEEEAKTGVESLRNLSDDITKAQASLADTKSRRATLQEQLRLNTQQAIDINALSQSPGVQQVLSEYQKTQDDLAVQRTRLTSEHPTIQNLIRKEQALKAQLELRIGETINNNTSALRNNLQIGQLKQSLIAELVKLEVDKLAFSNQIAVLNNAYSMYQKRLGVLPQLEQKQLQLERQLQVARSTYEQLLKRLQEIDVSVNQNVGNARVVSEALVPQQPVSPVLSSNLVLGGLIGVMLGVAIALLLEAMDKSLKTIEQAKQLLGYPLLGNIPRLFEKGSSKQIVSELPTKDSPYSPITAAFEMLQTNLSFTLSDRQLKTIVVVSSNGGEGKSFVAANLAITNAQMGRRVLLIDADMRQPRQHDLWKLPNSVGLSHILVSQAQLQTATQEVLINLNVMTAGTIPPNPAALLDSQRMGKLIEQAASDYDCVIIDTPSLTSFADGLILSKLADGMLLVARPELLDSTAVKTTKAMLEQSRSQVLGMVINGVISESNHSGFYTKIDRQSIPQNQTSGTTS